MTTSRSIRRRLFFQLAGVAAILSLGLVLVVRSVAENAAEATQDNILAASATAIADNLRSRDGSITVEIPYSALSMLGEISEDRVFYRVTAGGETLTGYEDLPVPGNLPRVGTPVFDTITYHQDEMRSVTVLRQLGAASAAVDTLVTVAQTREGLEAVSRRITSIATGVGVIFFALAAALSLWAASSALAPLVRLTGAVTRRGPKDLRPVTATTPTELEPLVEALNSFMLRLRNSLSRTEDFITEAAHRVRTPLATVRAQAEVTHRKLNKPEHKKAIREMIQAIDESSRSAGQMLDHAMVTFRADSLALEEMDMVSLVSETCRSLAPTADLKDMIFHQHLPDGPVMVSGDWVLLQAAVLNVLDNAVKYAPEDSEVSVSLSVDEEVRLEISDQGKGFGGMDLSRLTKRYERGTNVGQIVGSGLGLTIAKDVVEAHGGRLKISDNPEGGGACVSICLPL